MCVDLNAQLEKKIYLHKCMYVFICSFLIDHCVSLRLCVCVRVCVRPQQNVCAFHIDSYARIELDKMRQYKL